MRNVRLLNNESDLAFANGCWERQARDANGRQWSATVDNGAPGVGRAQAGTGCNLGINTPSQGWSAFGGHGDVVRKVVMSDREVV